MAMNTLPETGVDRLLVVAVHKIATAFNLPDSHKLAHPSPAVVGRLASHYRKQIPLIPVQRSPRDMFDATLVASQHALTLLQAARGTRPDMPGPACWALLLAALASIIMDDEPAALPDLGSFIDTLAEEIAQL